MKNLKKLISVIIAVIMIVGSFATVSAADYKDVESTDSFYKAIQVLSGLAIAKGDDEGNFNPDNEVKRSEMLAFVCRAMGEEDLAANSATNTFTDVAADHWAAGYIAWGVNNGIVNGMGDGTFAPDASVSYQDAVVMIMRALGYDEIAKKAQFGGYPVGYLKLASQYGVLKNAGFDNQAAAPRKIIAQLIYNALTAPLAGINQFGASADEDKFIIYDGSSVNAELRTLLTYTNDVVKVKADITATGKTNTALIDKEGNYKVTLNITNGYNYKMAEIKNALTGDETGDVSAFTAYAGETEAADLLGATVEAYLVEDEDLNAWKLLAVVADSKSVKSETLAANEVDFKAYTSGKFTYEDAEGNDEEIELATDAALYYNGALVAKVNAAGIDTIADGVLDTTVAAGTYDLEDLILAAEEITFTGSKTGAYDRIFLTDYAYAKVNKVYADDLYISATGLDLELSTEARNNKKFTYGLFDGEGNEITLEDVAEDDILNIVAPLKGGAFDLSAVDYMDIYVTSNVVTGAVMEEIGGGKYAINDDVYEVVSGSLTAGEEGSFFITIDGRVLSKDASSTIGRDFAFIVNAYTDTKYGGTVTEHTIRLFTADGEIVDFLVADKLKVDGASAIEDTALTTYIATLTTACADKADTNATATKAALKNRVITYKLNSDDEIKEITTVATFADTYSATTKYRKDIATFGGKKIADDTVLFIAPVKEVKTGKYNVDEDDLAIGSFDVMPDDKAKDYDATTFMFSGDKTLGAALLGQKVTSELDKAHLAVVTNKTSVADAEYDTLVKYTFVQGGEIVSLTVDPDYAAPTLAAGDIFRYTVNADGNIDQIEEIYTAATATFKKTSLPYASWATNDDFAIVYGKITKIEDGIMTVDDANSATDIELPLGETEGNTYASIDEDGDRTPALEDSDIKVLRSAASLRASAGVRNYRVVAIIGEADAFEDCVMIIE